MKKSLYSPEQEAFGLRQAEEGTPVAEICRKMAQRGLSAAGRRGSRAWAWPR